MIVYAESSAVVAWLLEEPRAADVSAALDEAERIVTSTLTRAECARAVVRGVSLGRLTKRKAGELLQALADTEASWYRLDLSDRVLAGASVPFPVEPVRTLDAIHLASADIARATFGDVGVLSFDDRVRANAAALGMTVLPSVAA